MRPNRLKQFCLQFEYIYVCVAPAGSGSGVHCQDEARAMYAKGKDDDLVSCFVISVSPGLVKFHVLG